MLRPPAHTDYRLWAASALGVFVALGFVDPLAGATWKGEYGFWHLAGILVREGADRLLPFLLLYAGLLSVPSALLGWVVQAILVLTGASVRGRRAERLPADSVDDCYRPRGDR